MQSKICELEHTSTIHVGRRSTILSAEGVRARFGGDLPSIPVVRCAEERSVTNGPVYYVLIDELPMLFAVGIAKAEQVVSDEDFWIPVADFLASYQPLRLRPVTNSVKNCKNFWDVNQSPVGEVASCSKEFSVELRMVGIFEPEHEKVLRGSGWLQEQDTGVSAGSFQCSRPADGPDSSQALCLPTPCVFFDAVVSLRQKKKSCKRMLWCSFDNNQDKNQFAVIPLDSDCCLLLSFFIAQQTSPKQVQRLELHLEQVSLFSNLETAVEYQRFCSTEFYDQLFSKPIVYRAEKNYRFNLSCPYTVFQMSIGMSKSGSADTTPVQQLRPLPTQRRSFQHHNMRTLTDTATNTRDCQPNMSPDHLQQLDSSDKFDPADDNHHSLNHQALCIKRKEPVNAFNFEKMLIKTEEQTSLEQELAKLSKRKVLNKKEVELLDQVLSGSNSLKSVSSSKSDCMVLQEALRKLEPLRQPQIIKQILELAVGSMSVVSCSIYGNFMMQIMISKLSTEQRIKLLYSIMPTFEQIACHPKGIFCLQHLIEQLQTPQEVDILLQCITPSVNRTVKNPQAGFVYKKAVQVLDENFSSRLWQLIRRNLADVCCDKYGICVVKFLISKFEKNFDKFKMIAKDFNKIVFKCKLNSHFNFGVQHLIEVVNKEGWETDEMEGMLSSYFFEENRLKIRSVSVAHTIVLILSYHRKTFIDNLLKNYPTAQTTRPLTPQESRIFRSLEEGYQNLRPYVSLLKMMTKLQPSVTTSPADPPNPQIRGFSHLLFQNEADRE